MLSGSFFLRFNISSSGRRTSQVTEESKVKQIHVLLEQTNKCATRGKQICVHQKKTNIYAFTFITP